MGQSNNKVILAVILVTVLLFVGGFLIGYFTSPDKSCDGDDERKTSEASRFEAHKKLYDVLDAEIFDTWLERA